MPSKVVAPANQRERIFQAVVSVPNGMVNSWVVRPSCREDCATEPESGRCPRRTNQSLRELLLLTELRRGLGPYSEKGKAVGTLEYPKDSSASRELFAAQASMRKVLLK